MSAVIGFWTKTYIRISALRSSYAKSIVSILETL